MDQQIAGELIQINNTLDIINLNLMVIGVMLFVLIIYKIIFD